MNILDAIDDPNLFRPFLGDNLESWSRWICALRALYGLPVRATSDRALIEQCCGRSAQELPKAGFATGLFLTGRRSGKSRIAAVIGAFESLFGRHEQRLAKGERGVLAICAPTKHQGGIVWKYLQAIFETPLLAREVETTHERSQAVILRSGIEVRVLVGDFRTIRGPALICAIVDEVCFFGLSEESAVRNDSELIRAIRPALATTGGKLIAISSKYAKRGWAFSQWQKFHGSNKGVSASFSPKWSVLVWDAASRVMNPTLAQSFIDEAFAEDPASARSEFGGEWREDVSEFCPLSLIESLVARDRKELMPRDGLRYCAGVDMSGGRSDSAALVIVHREERKVVQDFAREWKAPHNPHEVVREIYRELYRFGILSVTGDNFAGDWPKQAFRQQGVNYRSAERPRSDLYRELLPVLCGGKAAIELLDCSQLVTQLGSLERRTRSGGKDTIDHARGAHDDVANALAVAVDACMKGKRRVGALDDSLVRIFDL